MTYADEVLADAPFGYWPLTADFSDASGNSNTLTLDYGSGSFTGDFLTGTDSGGSLWLASAPAVDPVGGWTLEMLAPGSSPGTTVRVRRGSVSISLTVASGAVTAASSEDSFNEIIAAVDVGWHHCVARWDRTDLVLLVDGIEAGTVPMVHAWPSSSTPVGDIELSEGASVAHVAFYEGALSDARILAHATEAPLPDVEPVVPIDVPSVPAPELTGGVLAWVEALPNVLFVPSVPAPPLAGGVVPWPTRPTEPVYPPSVPAPPLIGGVHHTWSDTPNPPPKPRPDQPPWPTGVQYGPPTAELEVAGFPSRTAASCRPQLNDAGSGSFTTPGPGPGVGATITYTSGGGAVFTGVADQITDVIADSNEEAGQLVTVSTPGKLYVDWHDTVVYPDFGAGDPIRVGQPPQDDRIWGFPMNGLNAPGLTWTTSVGGDNARYGTEREIFPLPDNWPDIRSQWMWTTEVDVKSQPEGWCYFRMPFGLFPGEYSLFVCAYDYARVYVDGALVATVDQGGTTKRVELDFDWDYHLIAVEAYAKGGDIAGVLVSLLQRHAHAFGGTDCYSRGGWEALERPTVSLRSTPGKVLRRLVSEGRARGAPAGGWTCAFSDEADSSGNPWPTGEDAPLITTKVGMTYWDVLRQFSESLIDFYAAPAGNTLYAFVKDEGGSAGAIPWTHTVDAESIVEQVGGH